MDRMHHPPLPGKWANYLVVSERRSGRTLYFMIEPNDKIGKRLSDHGGFSLSEPSFKGSRPGRGRPAKLFELPGALP